MSDSTQTGLVALIDILGYQNLLTRNEPEIIAQEVIPILLGIRVKVEGLLTQHSKEGVTKELRDAVIEQMKWVSFSDTILLALPVSQERWPDDPLNTREVFTWIFFLMAVQFVHSELFSAGLPTRGAIDYGKYYIKDSCFAGRTIVNTYQLSQQIEMSACVFTEDAAKQWKHVGREFQQSPFDVYALEYLVPTKDGDKRMLVTRAKPSGINSANIHESVMRAFWGNRKEIPQTVRPKIENTEQWLDFQLQHVKTA